MIALLTLGVTATTARAETDWQLADPVAQRAVLYALWQQGNTWRFGSADPERGLDCSGLIRYAYGLEGIKLPHASWLQIQEARPVDTPLPGDIVYYPRHVMLYIGNGLIVHSPGGRHHVQIDPLPDRDDLRFGRIV